MDFVFAVHFQLLAVYPQSSSDRCLDHHETYNGHLKKYRCAYKVCQIECGHHRAFLYIPQENTHQQPDHHSALPAT